MTKLKTASTIASRQSLRPAGVATSLMLLMALPALTLPSLVTRCSAQTAAQPQPQPKLPAQPKPQATAQPAAQPHRQTTPGSQRTGLTTPPARADHWYQTGRASWYGKKFQGKATASGEVFDMNQMTAAHRTLPLGTWVRVTNTRNRKSVVVRINDRGPVPTSRVLDLSQAAARALGFTGMASVKVELLQDVADSIVADLQPPTLIPISGQ